jgi:hypothetical protein
MEVIIWCVVALFIILAYIAIDRHFWVKDIEKDLKLYLGDVVDARDCSEPPFRVHFDAQVFALKSLIRKHFEL